MKLPFLRVGTEGWVGGSGVELVTKFLEFRCGGGTGEGGGRGGYGCV